MRFTHERRNRKNLGRRLAIESLEDRFLLSYAVTDLGTLGGETSHAYGINASGLVVGQADTADGPAHAFMSDGTTMYDLGTLGQGGSSISYSINDAGQVAGSSRLPPGDGKSPVHAFLFDATGMHDLGTLDGGHYSAARSINASGQIGGVSDDAAGNMHAILFAGKALMRDLGTLGGKSSEAFGISDSGVVVGSSQVAPGDGKSPIHAFRCDATGMTDLGTLGGLTSQAYAINDSGQVAGQADTLDGNVHAFRYDASMRDLGTLGGVTSAAIGINATGDVVGWSQVGPGDGKSPIHAFVYTGGTMYDLNDLMPLGSGWTLSYATAVNDAGQIVGYGQDPRGQVHAFLLTPGWVNPSVVQANSSARVDTALVFVGKPFAHVRSVVVSLESGLPIDRATNAIKPLPAEWIGQRGRSASRDHFFGHRRAERGFARHLGRVRVSDIDSVAVALLAES